MKQRDTDLARCWREKQAGFAAAADMIGRLLDEWEAGRAEIDALRAVLIEAQECIDYGTRAGGAAEVLAHIATVLKGDGHATVHWPGGEMAVVAAAKAWRNSRVEHVPVYPEEAPLIAAVDRLLEAEKGGDASNDAGRCTNVPAQGLHAVTGTAHPNHAEVQGDESWQARRAELLAGLFSDDEDIPAALDRAFEFGREGRS